MATILVLAASNSNQSINVQLAIYAGSLLKQHQVHSLDLNDYEMPIYSSQREEQNGVPQLADSFLEKIESSDAIILSLAEHNGSFSAAFKNIIDWCSRKEHQVWAKKPMLLLSTSPGARGGANVLAAGNLILPRLGANIVASFSLPSFADNFNPTEGITQSEHKTHFLQKLESFSDVIN